MAIPESRLLAAVSGTAPGRRRAQSPAAARSGPETASARSPKEHSPRKSRAWRGIGYLCRRAYHRVSEKLGLCSQSGFGAGTKTVFMLVKNRLVVGFPRVEHMKNNSRQLVCRSRDCRCGSQLGPHSPEVIS